MPSYDMIKLEEVVVGTFPTFNPNTGANKNADSTPSITVYENGSVISTNASVSGITTGVYRWQLTAAAASGFETGKSYDVWATATVTGTDTVTQSAPVCNFKVVTRSVEDIPNTSEFNARTLPSGQYNSSASGDWTSTEKGQIRYVLGLDGSTSVPSVIPSGLFRANIVQINGSAASGVGTVDVDPTQIRSAVGLASANLDTQLGDIPTVSEMNARTLPSGTYSTLSSGNVVSATQTTIDNNYLQYLFASTYNPASKPGSATSIINSLIDSSVRQFSATALELAPQGSGGSGGSGDWTSTEKSQIRYVLGLDGTTVVPTATPSGLFRANIIQVNGVAASGTGTVSVDATEIRSAIGLASANLDTQLGDIPTVTEFNARTLPSGSYGSLSSGDVQVIVSSGVTSVQSTQASNAQTGAAAAITAYDPPTRAELTTDKDEILASGLTQAGVRAAVGLASANLDTQLADIPTVSEFNARTLPSGTYSTLSVADLSTALSSGVTVNAVSSGAFQDIFETYALVEAYPTNGQTGTPAELMYLMKQVFSEFTISGTNVTVKGLDGSTTVATYTLNSSTTPTSRTRAT